MIDASDLHTRTTPIPLRIVITFQRHTSQEPGYALFILDPILHQIWQILRAALALRHQLHLHALRIRRRLEDECRVKIVHRGDAHLPVIIEREFKPEN